MKWSIVLCVVLLGLGLSAFAQGSRVPAFDQYPARPEKVRTKAINFKGNPQARQFKTVLTESLHDGTNFAGHYIVAGWGCGAGCMISAIIDARTGNVFWPKELAGMYITADDFLEYKANSRLLIISDRPASIKELPRGNYYYEWKNNRLRLIRTVPRKNV